jgi:hypothetical protein
MIQVTTDRGGLVVGVADTVERDAARLAVREHRGVEVKTTGDRFLAGVEIGVGLHTGEREIRGADLAGMAVRIGRR